MWWIGLAVVAHASNALVFAVDKAILGARSRISSPVRYAALSGMAAAPVGLVLLFLPWTPSAELLTWSLMAGLAWVAALWWYFAALARGEATRVVPVTGAAVALVTLVLAAAVLGEALSAQQWLACAVLVVGSAVLSLKWREVQQLSGRTVLLAVLAGLSFAIYFVISKHVFDAAGSFLAPLGYMRAAVGVWAILLWFGLGRRGPEPRRVQGKGKGKASGQKYAIWWAFFLSKGLALGALVAQHYAIALGSVAVVNALQGTQYIFLLGVAGAVSHWRPKLLREELTRVAVGQKLAGIALIGVGLALLV